MLQILKGEKLAMISNVTPIYSPGPPGTPPQELLPKFVREAVEKAGLGAAFDLCLKTGEVFHLSIAGPEHFKRFVIEVVATQVVSCAHYTLMNGDLCADPELVFLCGKRNGSGLALPKSAAGQLPDRWLLKEVTMHLVQDPENPSQSFYRHYEKGVSIDTDPFPNTWGEALYQSGYLEQIDKGLFESSTHHARVEALKKQRGIQVEVPEDKDHGTTPPPEASHDK